MSFFQKVILQSLAVVTIMLASLSHAGETNKQLLARGMWHDQQTGLVWMRCPLGKTWTGDECSGEAELFNWWDAVRKAKQTKFGGYNDWRLPSAPELASLLTRKGFVRGVIGYKKHREYYEIDGCDDCEPFTGFIDGAQLKDIERKDIERNFATVLPLGDDRYNGFFKTRLLHEPQEDVWSATPASVRDENNKTLIWVYPFTLPEGASFDVLENSSYDNSVRLVRAGRSLGDFEKSVKLVEKGDPEEESYKMEKKL
jgi:hypothetical protein